MSFVITPTEKQLRFFSSDADICVYGGSAGSGKSWALLIDALGLNDEKFGPRILLSHYRALIYRKQYSHLSDLIDKSKDIYKKICPKAVYNSTEMVWRFPSGSQVQFTYLDTVQDCDKIQGKEYQYIGAEEISQYNTDKVMRYCLSRLRSAYGLKCYFRGTCNPSRYKWLRQTLKIDNEGNSTSFFVDTDIDDVKNPGQKIKKHIEFISARLIDNPHLGDEYKSQLMLLPEDERNALLYGRWDAYDSVDGAIYKKEVEKMYYEKRFCKVVFKKDTPYHAVFDLGYNDTTAIIFFHMFNNEKYIFDYYENRGEDINFYIDWMKAKGYTEANIHLPHDANQHKIESKHSIFETMKKHFKNVEVVKKLSIEEGIDIVRRSFDKIYFSNTSTERLLECLSNYRRKYNPYLDIYGDPLHDAYSNGADVMRYLCIIEPVKKFDFKFDNILSTHTI